MRDHVVACNVFGAREPKRGWTAHRWQHLALVAAGATAALLTARSVRKDATAKTRGSVQVLSLQQKEALKKEVLQRQELINLRGKRLRKLRKSPLWTLSYYSMRYLSFIKPFRVNYKTLWGDNMSFFLPEAGNLYYFGFYEANLTNFMINSLREGDTFVDIGAHVGFYSMLGSSLVGPEGRVLSFEPTPRTFAELSENAGQKANIAVFNSAVLDEETEIEFFDYGLKYSSFNSFKKRTSDEIFFKEKAEKIRVPTTNIDTLCETNNVVPTFIKIDAEGSEHLVLKGMSKLLDEVRPNVSIEVSGGDEWADNCAKSIKALRDKGYECFEISPEGYLTEHTPLEVYEGGDNLIFVHHAKRDAIKDLITS